jgi:hypothetical protein
MNLVYNMKRLVQFIKRDERRAKRDFANLYREARPEQDGFWEI